jgi:hypothetical protein
MRRTKSASPSVPNPVPTPVSTVPSSPVTPAGPDDLLTVTDLAQLLRCKRSSIFNLTRRRGRARYDNPVPVLRLPCGLRFRRASILEWLGSMETKG